MQRLNSIYFKLFIPTFLILVGFAAVLYMLVTQFARQVFLEYTRDTVAAYVSSAAPRLLTRKDFEPSETPAVVFGNFFSTLHQSQPDLVRIKVWGRDAEIIYSDDPSIIGKRYPDNHEYQEAIGGKIEFELTKPLKPEHASERGYRQLAEVYVPVRFIAGEEPMGVIEAYWKLDGVNRRIADFQQNIALILIIGIAALYVLNAVVVHAVLTKRLQGIVAVIRKIMGGEYAARMSDGGRDELGEVIGGVNSLAKSLESSVRFLEEFAEEGGDAAKQRLKEIAAERPQAAPLQDQDHAQSGKS